MAACCKLNIRKFLIKRFPNPMHSKYRQQNKGKLKARIAFVPK